MSLGLTWGGGMKALPNEPLGLKVKKDRLKKIWPSNADPLMINIRENQKISDPKIFETQFFGTTNFLGNFQDLKFVFLKFQLFNVYSLIYFCQL